VVHTACLTAGRPLGPLGLPSDRGCKTQLIGNSIYGVFADELKDLVLQLVVIR
jgi:hypothetical protein